MAIYACEWMDAWTSVVMGSLNCCFPFFCSHLYLFFLSGRFPNDTVLTFSMIFLS